MMGISFGVGKFMHVMPQLRVIAVILTLNLQAKCAEYCIKYAKKNTTYRLVYNSHNDVQLADRAHSFRCFFFSNHQSC